MQMQIMGHPSLHSCVTQFLIINLMRESGRGRERERERENLVEPLVSKRGRRPGRESVLGWGWNFSDLVSVHITST